MFKQIIIILLTVTAISVFGCKKLEESGITIDKAITVLEFAKTAQKMINAGNANSVADELLKEIDSDKGTDEEEAASEEETE